jgi:hypothetical protein
MECQLYQGLPPLDQSQPSPAAPKNDPVPTGTVQAALDSDVHEELHDLVTQLVQLKVGLKAACASLAREMAGEGLMSLEELRPLPVDEALDLLEKVGMKKLQIKKVVESYCSVPVLPSIAHPDAPTASAPALALNHAHHERALWLKGCLVLEACAKGLRPFVCSIMERLLKRVIENVKQDIARDLSACNVEEWDCSTCADATDSKFTDNSPVKLCICSMNSNGIADCGTAHHLKPYSLTPCHLSNIPAGCFHDSEAIIPGAPLFMCPDPAHFDNAACSTFVLLQKLPQDSTPSARRTC